ncbi:MAG: NUDIX hydrolase [Kiritimatiellae bacterium]|nr:NUDIX hydrolase [Kiritimatiellia bacterium]
MREKTLKARTVFKGRLLAVEVLDVELECGKRSIREIVRHPGAAVVLAQLEDGRFVFVRQFRKAAEKTILEIVAGGLEKGESPVDCARRELREETGYTARKLVSLGTVYPAPGYTDEVLHLYFAITGRVRGSGSPDEDERLTVEYFTEKQVDRMIRDGRIHDAKTLAAWMLWKAKTSRK